MPYKAIHMIGKETERIEIHSIKDDLLGYRPPENGNALSHDLSMFIVLEKNPGDVIKLSKNSWNALKKEHEISGEENARVDSLIQKVDSYSDTIDRLGFGKK